VTSPWTPRAPRTQRLLQLSATLRTAAGPTDPLGAIVPSPLGLQAHHGYWPGFPWPQIAQTYDAILPMSYFTWGPRGEIGAYENITGCVRLIRKWVGNDLVPIHEIGGLSQHATADETRGFADAVRDKLGSGVAVLAAEVNEKHTLLAVITDDLRARGIRADVILKEVAAVAGGRGGGKAHMAQAGIPDGARIPEALAAVVPVVMRLIVG